MPIYEYECPEDGRFEKIEVMRDTQVDVKPGLDFYVSICPECGQGARSVISVTHWYMGWKYLKDKSEKSPPAPTDAGYHKEWDEAYGS